MIHKNIIDEIKNIKIKKIIEITLLLILLGALGTCIWWNMKSDREIEQMKLNREKLNDVEKEELNKKLSLKRVEYYISIWLIISLSLSSLRAIASLLLL